MMRKEVARVPDEQPSEAVGDRKDRDEVSLLSSGFERVGAAVEGGEG